uniref:PP2C-like domain-containing protein n=2 Tax=Ascaris suum TaxID=6253 RepID=F1KU98_ASCSU
MPSKSIRKRVYGLIRTTFSPGTSIDTSDAITTNTHIAQYSAEPQPSTPTASNSFISQCILNGRNGHKNEAEIYAGKTGLDLPVLMIEPMSSRVRACHTGPDGGLTEVGGMRRQPIVKMANLDDELSVSFDGDSLDEWEGINDQPQSSNLTTSQMRQSSSGLVGSCSSLIGPSTPGIETPRVDTDSYDWKSFDEERCFGVSTSLYERNPLTGVNAGNPIADVFGIVARDNNVIMALADGVNWGEGARLAARCAIRGAIDHLNYHLFADPCKTTTEIFHALLGAFHSAHALILQEGGLLTTLCVAVATQLRQSNTWALCVCNVGDSLCFVYNPTSGVREVTIASHDVFQMRDMRDAGGALGPVDGTNPQLHNLTCSMTFVEPDDVIFITSDGVSDNFDPVVGKFCVIKKTEANAKENNGIIRPVAVTANNEENTPDWEFARTRTCNATLPCVDAEQRHELMLLRMGDIVSNGILPPSVRSRCSPTHHLPVGGVKVSSSKLCHNLIQFARQLSMAKRRTLEDPELYRNEKTLSKSEQRSRRKAIRLKLSEMPGKLDHASVVAFKVGIWPDSELLENGRTGDGEMTPLSENGCLDDTVLSVPLSDDVLNDGILTSSAIQTTEVIEVNVDFAVCNEFYASAETNIRSSHAENASSAMTLNLDDPISELVNETVTTVKHNTPVKSPYEETPVAWRMNEPPKTRKKHPRGSVGRHTLSVDVQWLKKLVTTRNSANGNVSEEKSNQSRHSLAQEENERTAQPVSLRQRLRILMGSTRNVRQQSAACAPTRGLPPSDAYPKQIASANSSPKKRPQAY